MGQYWKIVNIDRRCQINTSLAAKMGQILSSGYAEDLVDLLKVVKIPPVGVSEDGVARARARNAQSHLIKLPAELVTVISALVDDDVDLVCFAMTCSYLWRMLLQDVRKIVIADGGGCWAGDRLVFVGDYAKGVPPGCEDVQEAVNAEIYSDGGNESNQDENGANYDYNPKLFKLGNPLYELADVEIESRLGLTQAEAKERFQKDDDQIAFDGPGFDDGDGMHSNMQPHRKNQATDTLLDRLLDMMKYPQGKPTHEAPGVLRNLTTKEYVNDSVLAESEYSYSLGEVVCTQTTWTADSSGLNDLPCEGDWAGHRFDIVSIEEVGDGWADVSNMVVAQLEDAVEYKKSDGKRAWFEVHLPRSKDDAPAEGG